MPKPTVVNLAMEIETLDLRIGLRGVP